VVIQHPLTLEEFVWALSAFCQLNRIPFDANLVAKHYPPPYTSTQLETALKGYGFNTTQKKTTLADINKASLPCLAMLKPAPLEVDEAKEKVDAVESSSTTQTNGAESVDLDADASEQVAAPAQSEAPVQPNPLLLNFKY